MNNNYDDIINLPRPQSKHPKMSLEQRSAQFAPFAALTGFEESVYETSRITDERICFEESIMNSLDYKFQIIKEKINETPLVIITYFLKDKTKNGGRYECYEGIIKKIDFDNQLIKFEDGNIIPICDIMAIESDIFKDIIF